MSQTATHSSCPPLFLPDDEDVHMEPPSSQNWNTMFNPSISDGATGALRPHNCRTVMHSWGVLGGDGPTQIMLEYPMGTATTQWRDAHASHGKERPLMPHDDVSKDGSHSRLNQSALGLRSSLRHIAQMYPHIHQVFEERTRDAVHLVTSFYVVDVAPAPPTSPTSTIPAHAVPEQDPNHSDSGRNESPTIKSEEAEFHSASKSDRPDQSRVAHTTAQPGAAVAVSGRQRVIFEGVYISDSDDDDEEEEEEGHGEQPPDSSSEDNAPARLSEKARGKLKVVEPDQQPSNDEPELHLSGNLAPYEESRDEEGEIGDDRREVQQVSNPSNASSEAEEGELDDAELFSDGTGAGSEADIDRLMRGTGRGAGDAGQNDHAGEGGEPNYAPTQKKSNDELDSLFGENFGAQPTPTRKRVRSINDQGPPSKRAAPRDSIYVQDSSSDEAPVASSSTMQNRPRSSNTTTKSRLVVPRRNRPIVSNAYQQKYNIAETIELVELKFRINVQTIRRLHTVRSTMDPQDLDVQMNQAILNILEAKWWITLQDVRNSHVAELLSGFRDDVIYSADTRKLVYDFLNALHERFKGGTIFVWKGRKSKGFLDNLDFSF